MAVLALATPLLSAWLLMRQRQGKMKLISTGRLVLLALVGPVNFFFWVMFADAARPQNPAIGIILAATVFTVLAFALGFLRKRR
jgi:hypothetical protein